MFSINTKDATVRIKPELLNFFTCLDNHIDSHYPVQCKTPSEVLKNKERRIITELLHTKKHMLNRILIMKY